WQALRRDERQVMGTVQMTVVLNGCEDPHRRGQQNCELVGDRLAERSGEFVLNLAVRKETATMDDAVERLRPSKRSSAETERESGPEVGEEWATEAAKYGELLRIAKAVEEARREIDLQTLQDLIDPEHKMDAGDWVRFWEDRGF